MQPHVHMSPVHALAMLCVIVIFFGTAHLISLTHDNRASRAMLAMGF